MDELIAGLPAFAGLDAEASALIAGCARNAVFAAGTIVEREGRPADTFHVLREGRVALEVATPAGPPLIIETLGEGQIVGWSWLFPPYRWHFDVRALESLHVATFDAACLRGKIDADHDLGFALLTRFSQVMLERLQSTRLRLLDVYGTAAV
jgi:CRP-like cAMP-binding protein